MAWIIDVDHVADADARAGTNRNAVGMMSADFTDDTEEICERFRMLDDDGDVYYEGRCSEQSFDPLDDFGAPNAGCTEIQYWNEMDNEWQQL